MDPTHTRRKTGGSSSALLIPKQFDEKCAHICTTIFCYSDSLAASGKRLLTACCTAKDGKGRGKGCAAITLTFQVAQSLAETPGHFCINCSPLRYIMHPWRYPAVIVLPSVYRVEEKDDAIRRSARTIRANGSERVSRSWQN